MYLVCSQLLLSPAVVAQPEVLLPPRTREGLVLIAVTQKETIHRITEW